MNETSDPELEGGRHDCPICPRRFDSVGDKKRHIRSKHPKETR